MSPFERLARTLAFFAGLGLTINQSIGRHGPSDPSLYVLWATMMGYGALPWRRPR
jgi:hypothetical protein